MQLISLHMEHPWPHRGVCFGQRLQCKLANLTNHKFPVTGATGIRSEVQTERTTSLLRTKWLVPKVSFVKRFHCSYYVIISPRLHPDTPDSANIHETSPASNESTAVMPGNYTDKVRLY